MRKSTGVALAAIALAAVGIRLSPLLGGLYWGSDFGEYFGILRFLTVYGHMPVHYVGWGSTYPWFPGMFFAQEALVGLGGLDLPTVLNLLIPILGALAVLPIFLLSEEIVHDRRVALFVAAFVAGVMPHVYATSHTAPATLGDLLAFTSLLLFLRLRRDPRVALPLVLVTATLITTHHLSAYFVILMVLGALVLRGLLRPFVWDAGAKREVGYAGFLLVGTLAYWFGYAAPFRDNILVDVNVQPWWILFVAFGGLLLVLALAVRARGRVTWRYRPRYPDLRYSLAMFGLALGFVVGLAAGTVLGAVPGTSVSLPPIILVDFAPLLILLAFSSAGRKSFDFMPHGTAVSAWFLALAVSALAGSVVATRVLIPYRHIEYLIVPVGILAGVGFFRLLDLASPTRARRTAAVVAGCALLAGNFAFAIPPPSFVAGWNEATQPVAMDGVYWAHGNLRGLVAADHMASTNLFGFGGVNATWDTTVAPFFATTWSDARPGLVSIAAPAGTQNATYVWLDQVETHGVELRVWEPAVPMSPAAIAKFSASPFVKVYDDGYAQVYWIAWGCDGSC
ncbi:MAG TPA: hypothetical protein VEY12_04580 [Thermoplasmata archaeon]|nr:hypothetical protein [Thermoplasmata archaeon]